MDWVFDDWKETGVFYVINGANRITKRQTLHTEERAIMFASRGSSQLVMTGCFVERELNKTGLEKQVDGDDN